MNTPRVGTFFLLIGFFLLILFLGSGFSKQPDFVLLLISLPALALGYLFRRNAPRKPSERFSAVRKAHANLRQRKEEKEKKK